MDDYTIKFDPMETMMRHCIDMAIHGAIERFRDELGDNVGLTHKIARIAAETAVEQFKTYCNAQLRIISVDHEMRASLSRLTVQKHFIADAIRNGG